MCGINGIIFKTSKTDVSKILKMNALLDHRGPDDSGFINHKNRYIKSWFSTNVCRWKILDYL